MTKALLFDWDGILADTAPDIHAAAGCAFVAVSYGYYRNGVLPPASRVVDSLLELCDDVTGEFLLHKGKENYVSA